MTQIRQVSVACASPTSFRVEQVRSLFGMAAANRMVEQFQVELPADRDDWSLGLIVGPSGSGKSSIAREIFGDAVNTTQAGIAIAR